MKAEISGAVQAHLTERGNSRRAGGLKGAESGLAPRRRPFYGRKG